MPIATTTALLIASGVGLGTQAVGQWKAGSAAKKAGEAAQSAANSAGELADFNANVADLQAADAITRGKEEEARYRTIVRGAVGTQRAGFAASNIDVNYGSAVDVQADAAELGELDALQIRTNAAREAWGYQVQATDYRRRGEISRKEGAYALEAGKSQQTAARIGAVSGVLAGGTSLLEQRYGFGRAGR